jgi:mutual gliding-motility protein MglA
VLKGVDAVAFIATGERDQMDANTNSWTNYLENLSANSLDIHDVPTVIQFNKMDLPNSIGPKELRSVEEYSGVPAFGASAIEGKGTYDTLNGLMKMLWNYLCDRQSLDERLGLSTEEFESHVKRVFGSVSSGMKRNG